VGAALVVLVVYVGRQIAGSDPLASAVDSSQYQYVTLTNGESYFGKLDVPGGDFCYLRHVYALTAGATKPGKPPLHTLVRLVDEVHNPQDLLVIRRDQIVYVENLNPNGKGARLLQGKGGS
jgi:hypothetical protein